MKGLKFIKTIFGDKKEIICVTFDGDNNYQLFLDEVRKSYSLRDVNVDVLSKGFKINPSHFSDFVKQFIGSTDFVLDIKLSSVDVCVSNTDSAFESESIDSPSAEHFAAAHQAISCIGEETFLNSSQDIIVLTSVDNLQSLPSKQTQSLHFP
ncbi:uncharacterized protein LOC101889859 [Musca domestica]|uniref:Uncharacterized protein LOC101889859 n=1 Tax=Musca domestica TaxID=7370 RepID=A0ABM3UMH5_MUSDO|nr:uncharacterized protein LOC101889859 [Musca domestica]